MPLPVLPGLMKTDDDGEGEDLHTEQAEGLTQFLDGLDEDQIMSLVSAADEYAAEYPDEEEGAEPADEEADEESPDSEVTAEDESADPDTGDTEPAPPPDGSESEEEGDGSGSIDAIDAQMDDDLASAAHVIEQIQDLADGDSDSAPDVAKLLKQASSLSEKLDKQRKLLDRAMKAEDPQAAAQAGMDAQDALTAMEKLLEAAQALGAKTEAPKMTDKDHPAIKAWAAKVQGKKLAGAAPAAAPKPSFGK